MFVEIEKNTFSITQNYLSPFTPFTTHTDFPLGDGERVGGGGGEWMGGEPGKWWSLTPPPFLSLDWVNYFSSYQA
jgi:hypothetical protein